MEQLGLKYLSSCFALSIGGLFYLLSINIAYSQNQDYEPSSGKALEIYISEIAHVGNVSYNFIELFNPTSAEINLSAGNYYLCFNDASTTKSVALSGSIGAGETYVCSIPYSWFFITLKWFFWEYGINPDQQNSKWEMNNTCNVVLYKGGDANSGNLIDIYGELGEELDDLKTDFSNAHAVRKGSINEPNSNWSIDEWVIVSGASNQMSPGQHATSIQYQNTSGSWNTRGNWSGMGYVPDASSIVTISANQSLDITAASACHDLQISPNGNLNITPGNVLTVSGELNNLAGATALNIQASSIGPASLLHQTDGVMASVQSYFNDYGSNQWYLISVPIAQAQANVFMGQYLDYWDEPSSQWISIENETTHLKPTNGYSLRKDLDELATYVGELNNGQLIAEDLSFTNNGASFGDGWNLLGNPYPSVLDVAELDFDDDMVASVCVWPHGINGPYLVWSQGGGGNEEARYIQPGQGFMVQVMSSNQSLSFGNDARCHQNLASFDKMASSPESQASLLIQIKDEFGKSDECYVSFKDEASWGFDTYYDAHKLLGGNLQPHIFTCLDFSSEEKLSINSIPYAQEGESISLAYKIAQSGIYEFSFKGMNKLPNDQQVFLRDLESNEIADLRADSVFQFFLDKNNEAQRFQLLFDMNTALEMIKKEESQIYYAQDYLIINQDKEQVFCESLCILNLIGQKVFEQEISEEYQRIKLHLPAANYIVQLRGDHIQKNYKVFIR